VEGSAWQYRFSGALRYGWVDGGYGRTSGVFGYMEEMLSQPPVFHVGSYGSEIHEMSEMAAVDSVSMRIRISRCIMLFICLRLRDGGIVRNTGCIAC